MVSERTTDMYFDSHAHLNDPKFAEDLPQVLEKIRAAQVTKILNIGCCWDSSQDCVTLANTYDFIWCAVGTHPDIAEEADEALMERYRQLILSQPRVKAIGEIGLDYFYETPPRDVQKRAFRLQMELAQQLEMPVVVHERQAHGDGMAIIDEFPKVKGVFHCYSGSPEMAKELIKRGWYVGFTGVLTFKNARKALEAAAAVPLERILIETDCPFMAPEPFRGTRNDPSLVPYMAKKLAEVRGISVEEAARATMENACRLFRID